LINPYLKILQYDKPDLKDYLDTIGIDAFKPLLKEFSDPTLFRGAVKFILYAYSLESEVLHTFGNSWVTVYKTIYEKAGLPDNENTFDAIANLKSGEVREAIDNWLAFQENEAFTEYTKARDLRRYCLGQSQSADKTKDRVEAMKYAKDLLAIMEDSKSKFVANYEIMKAPLNALKKEKQSNTLGPQHYAD